MPCRDYEEPKTRKASDLVTQNNHLAALLCKACGLLAMGETALPADLQEWYNSHLVADRAAAVEQINEGELKVLTVSDILDISNICGLKVPQIVSSVLGLTNDLQAWILNCEVDDFIAYQEIIEGVL